MIRTLLASTALAALVATGAFAQTEASPGPATPSVQQPAAGSAIHAEGSIVTNIIGESVYNGPGDDAENIGKVTDVVFDKDGMTKSVVIGVGGFLGVGTKDVAFDYDKLQWAEKNGDRWLIAKTTKDELKAQPEFDSKPYEPAPAPAASNAAAPAATDTAQAPAAAPAEPVKRADGNLATNIIGETVYNGTGDDAQNIGEVNDIVLSKEGKAESLVIGVGGFLGLGAKNVTYDFSKAKWAEKNGDRWLVAQTTKEELQAQPDFNRKAYDPVPATTASNAPAATTPAAAPSGTTAPAAPANKTAQAPASPDASAPDQTQTAAIDKSALTEMPIGELRGEDLKGTTVYGANDAKVGEIGDVVLTPDNKPDAVIVDVGGFLGIGSKEVAVGMDNLKFMTDKNGKKYLYTTFTKEQLQAQTAYDKGSYAEKRDQQRMIVR
ncbi:MULTISPECIES: PRC-barrel domain-containing protein [unclassified Mesorhizobium]|uniref:PRC-barrel domain-containing protein n=1 Tax=unclassified Mesorhizobium TaxID=325217 RepID=UPI00112839DC|nr:MULTISPECIES: PRC-barrel domain-containing protein [unclassified Mesorhizobium]TPN49313.1 PRC-barrel domain containing protein [Mesorhizobium sp. B1-1-7]TPN51731.1 PRC-barrel domain containing protein [Mesorhizobium sp. B1-1-9]